ncbi:MULTISPECIES: DUF3073 domain-containing protein [Thermomonospora]|uniref:DNA polymerase III epsilon subunit-like protein n=1 Tax=Thermomonospora cellulosilytica TaxID=1411118 RepID=A0A7W3MVB5_9ACTN|nr:MULTISPECIES: DUF3073 domain-containing protein [Thermomonospora]MBA9002558.1 DNA polymerase III epsilon subunit-like protein [Thermomonospora cellulosilytica]
MGRGRAKAKQVKVARRLKYNSGGTDLDRLKEELGVPSSNHHDPYDDSYDDLIEKYADYADTDDGEDDRPGR